MAPYQEAFQDGSLTLVGASRRSGVPYHALLFAVKQGHLPVEKRGRRVAIDRVALDHYMAGRH